MKTYLVTVTYKEPGRKFAQEFSSEREAIRYADGVADRDAGLIKWATVRGPGGEVFYSARPALRGIEGGKAWTSN